MSDLVYVRDARVVAHIEKLQARIEQLEAALRAAQGSITAIAAECHRAKWEFDSNEVYTPPRSAARAIIVQAFSVLSRIGDIAIKAKNAALAPEQDK
jgi:hypothetical protein